MGNVQTEMPPPRVMMIDNTEAKIGRLIKERENTTKASTRNHEKAITRCKPTGCGPWVRSLASVLNHAPQPVGFCSSDLGRPSPCGHGFFLNPFTPASRKTGWY